jgi:hypothetical protein
MEEAVTVASLVLNRGFRECVDLEKFETKHLTKSQKGEMGIL